MTIGSIIKRAFKKSLTAFVFGSLFLIPFISAAFDRDLPSQKVLDAELAQASLGNNIFFGVITAILVIILVSYLIYVLKKNKKNKK